MPELVERARELRKQLTDAERKLWYRLNRRQLDGHKFRRQAPMQQYVLDFVCYEKRLVIEVDGGQHADQAAYDAKRTRFLESQGFRVLRFWNNEVWQNIDGVLERILEVLNTGSHSPLVGESKLSEDSF